MTIEKVDYTTTPHPSGVVALSLKEAPALIESLLPVQKLSIDVYKERMAGAGQTLTSLGSYWKGRKPLVLNRACVLASLLPATDNPVKDLEIFELLMGMDGVSLSKRQGLAKPEDILRGVTLDNIEDYFEISPPELSKYIPKTSPVDLRLIPYFNENYVKFPKIRWREDISEAEQHALAAQLLETGSYREVARDAKRAEEVPNLSAHIWRQVNAHLNTKANSFSQLVEQLGVMRFGHRPTVSDTFSGSGQIPFAAAQLGCDVYASDLNPIACMLTWGAFNIVGATDEQQQEQAAQQQALVDDVRAEIDALGFESDGNGWQGKAYLYCLEVKCPSSGWMVPVLPNLLVSKGKCVVAKLVPDEAKKRYDIVLVNDATASQLKAAEAGTYRKGNVVHTVGGVEHINSISAIRGDYAEVVDGKKQFKNKLRLWGREDFVFRTDDIFNERLYAIQWIKENERGRPTTEFRTVGPQRHGLREKGNRFRPNTFGRVAKCWASTRHSN